MRAGLERVWHDVQRGENIDLYVTAAVAIALVVLNLFGLAQSWTAPITLAVLALLAVSTLTNRRKLDDISTRLGQLGESILLPGLPASLSADIQNCKEWWMVGFAFGYTVQTHYEVLENKLRSGHSLKVLVLDPSGISTGTVTQRLNTPTTQEQMRTELLIVMTKLCSLKKIAPTRVEIRTIDYPLPFGLLAGDLKANNGVIYVKQYAFQADMPVMVLHPQDRQWFQFFANQLTTIWAKGNEWLCNSSP